MNLKTVINKNIHKYKILIIVYNIDLFFMNKMSNFFNLLTLIKILCSDTDLMFSYIYILWNYEFEFFLLFK